MENTLPDNSKYYYMLFDTSFSWRHELKVLPSNGWWDRLPMEIGNEQTTIKDINRYTRARSMEFNL